MPLSVTPSSNFLGESSRGSDENIPRQTGCDVCGCEEGVEYCHGTRKKKKKERKERERGKKRDKIATPLPVGGVEAPVEAPVQSSWHTYELCIRCSLCVIARCIIIPGEKVSVTIPSGTRYPWNRWKNAGWRPIQRMGIVTMRIEIEIISNRK